MDTMSLKKENERYKDLGWENSWNEKTIPEIIKKCEKEQHKKTKIKDEKGTDNQVICNICKTIYHYDSTG